MKPVCAFFSLRNLIILFSVLAVASCATKTQMHGVKPAEVSLGGIRTLAIVKFKGHHGEAVRGSLYNKLSDSNHFNLIDMTPYLKFIRWLILGRVDQDFAPIGQHEQFSPIGRKRNVNGNSVYFQSFCNIPLQSRIGGRFEKYIRQNCANQNEC